MELEAIGKRPRASSGSSSLASDRLSSLPDCLIHHIMSFLKARQVVQTCVLSTRWRHLWRSVPCLDIDQEEFKTAGPNGDTKKEWYEFEDFTDHLLIPNNISIGHLDTFRLQLNFSTYSYPYDKGERAARWIRHGIKYSDQDPGIQRKELNSTSWRLKRLHLCNIDLDDNFMKHVSSGCPYLEDMELKHCKCTFHEITSHTLKNLIMKSCRCSELSVVTAPMLNSLIVDGGDITLPWVMAPAVAYLLLDMSAFSFEGGFSFDKMSSLAKASIFLRDTSVGIEFSKEQFKLLCSVSNVTNLVLSGFQTMVIGEEFPEFQNLRTLLLEKCDLSDNFQTLGNFPQHSPNLEKLTLDHCKFSNDPKKNKGKVKSNKGYLNQFDVRCKNLKLTEISTKMTMPKSC